MVCVVEKQLKRTTKSALGLQRVRVAVAALADVFGRQFDGDRHAGDVAFVAAGLQLGAGGD